MRLFDLIAILTVLAALFSYVNFRYLQLPSTIGLMVLSLVFSASVRILGHFVPWIGHEARVLVGQLALDEALLHGMLGFLLFAGALHINLSELARQWGAITILASLGVVLSTAIVGGLAWSIFRLLESFEIRFIHCLLFGALISPTDPIAVLRMLKQIGAPKALEVQIAGESLFNDGIGVVVFTGVLEIATTPHAIEPSHFLALFLKEAGLGAVFGLVAGLIAFRLLKSVDDYQVEIMLSLALVAGGYALAERLGLSGPIAMVVAGLVIGNHGRSFAMSPTTVEHLDLFWELVDEILNAVLFVLIGIEVIVLTINVRFLTAGLLVALAVVAARFISVGIPVWFLRRLEQFDPSTIPILTWGGLKGGISVALALSVPSGGAGPGARAREVIVNVTYVVVVFSILVQGLTVGPYTRRWLARHGGSSVTKDADPGASSEPAGSVPEPARPS